MVLLLILKDSKFNIDIWNGRFRLCTVIVLLIDNQGIFTTVNSELHCHQMAFCHNSTSQNFHLNLVENSNKSMEETEM